MSSATGHSQPKASALSTPLPTVISAPRSGSLPFEGQRWIKFSRFVEKSHRTKHTPSNNLEN